jgi:hypothetical protein
MRVRCRVPIVEVSVASVYGRRAVVNVSVPRPWENDTNAAIGSAPGDYPSATLVDWKSASADDGSLFRSDGFHLTQKGTELWVALILSEATR